MAGCILTPEREAVLKNHPLHRWRIDRRLSRRALAEKLSEYTGHAPIHFQTVTKWEHIIWFPIESIHEPLKVMLGEETFTDWKAYHGRHLNKMPD
jgi:hypothetical protein